MTVAELKKALEGMPDDHDVCVCVNEPPGYMCPDGAVVGVKRVVEGIDWHTGTTLIVPMCSLDIHDVGKWEKDENAVTEEKLPEDKSVGKSKKKDEPLIHGMTIPEYIRVMERAHEATKNSTLVFK